MSWRIVMVSGDNDAYKGHFVPQELYAPVRDSLLRRVGAGAVVVIDEPATEAVLDLPGMCSTDRPMWEHTLPGGLRVAVPATDFDWWVGAVYNAEREVSPAPMVKVYAWRHVLVLTPTQHHQLVDVLNGESVQAIREVGRHEAARMAKARADLQVAGVLAPDPQGPLTGAWN